MITKEQFDAQLGRLIDTFGDRAFSEQRAYMIWKTVSHLTRDDFQDIVDNFIRCAKQAPLPAEFSEAVSKKGGRGGVLVLGELRPKETALCHDCADSGFVRLWRKDGADDWAKWVIGSAPCHCQRGAELIEVAKRKRKVDLGPQFSDYWRRSYSVMRPYDDSAGPNV